jgi:hypothetical protein
MIRKRAIVVRFKSQAACWQHRPGFRHDGRQHRADSGVVGKPGELTLVNAGALPLVHDAEIRRRKWYSRPHRPV